MSESAEMPNSLVRLGGRRPIASPAKPAVENSVTNAEQRRSLEEAIVDTVREPLIVLDEDLRVLVASRSFYGAFATAREDTDGRFLYELGNGQWNIPSLR